MVEIVRRENRVRKNWWRQGGGRRSQAQRHQRRSCRNRDRSRDRFRLRRRSVESISHNVLVARNVYYRAGELSQVGQVTLLPATKAEKP